MDKLRSRVIRLAASNTELRPHLLPLLREASLVGGELKCDMEDDCKEAVTHVDNKGYAYCARHGVQRKQSGTPCRQLRPGEIRKLQQGQPIRY